MRRTAVGLAFSIVILGALAVPRHLVSRTAVSPDFAHFESGHVHPAALTPSADRLLVVNTPDARLSVFDLTGERPVRVAEIPVGLEPVSVAALDDSVAWVVNHLSDDVSVVDLTTLHVRTTLRVGDEPSDVVFAGSPVRAYVSVSQEDRVKVYDPADLSAAPVVIEIDGRMPRALARDSGGTKVFAAVFHAGNRTSVLSANEVPADSMPADSAYPRSPSLPPRPPRIGLIVQEQDGDWRDMYGKLWNHKIKYTMHEVDVAEISTASHTVTRRFGGLGSVNFGIAVSPDGRVGLTATEALNLLRLEPRLKGHMVDTRVAFVDPTGTLHLRGLNPHIDYDVLPGTAAERDSALGIPTGIAFSSDGQRAYVTAMGSDRLAVLDPFGGPVTTILSRVPTVAGPTGVVVDDTRGRLYVVGRFRNQLQTLSTADFSQIAIAGIGFDPTPDEIVNGRKFFYGGFTSAHGDQACATCHVFGDFDNLAWDLGDPNGTYQPPPPGMLDPFLEGFDPEKGPMVTQSLRGLPNTGILHWRGDREDLNAFNPAFVDLMGRESALPDSEMAAFSEFVLPLVYPPNPNQLLDRTMPDAPSGQPSARRGQTFFMNFRTDGGALRCNDCHTVPTGTNGQVINDAALQEDQDIKVPQLRNMYKKTGFTDQPGAVNKRGFGFIHDGSIDNLFNFLKFPGFVFGSDPDADRRDVEAFLLAFDTGMAPAVGHQITFDAGNRLDPASIARMNTLVGQADVGNCDLIAKGRIAGQPRGWRYAGFNLWESDKASEELLGSGQLRFLAGAGSEITLTGVPPGSGLRMGVDRDRDTFRDGDELDAGSDPGDPASTPLNVGVTRDPEGSLGYAMRGARPNPFRNTTEIAFHLGRAGRVDLAVYDVLGRRTRSIARGLWVEAGNQSLRWDGRTTDGAEAPGGVYFVRLRTEGGEWIRPVARVR